MHILQSFESIKSLEKPIALTIGNFDGVHRGHQAIFQRMKELTSTGTSIAISFSNHPLNVLRPHTPVLSLCTNDHKIHLLEHEGIDFLFFISFTKSFSSQTPQQFLASLKDLLAFDYLILGHDAVLGKDREGTPDHILSIAKELHFHTEYLPAMVDLNGPISSSRIRQLIREGQLHDAAALLGRPFSYYSTVCQGAGEGRRLGYHTANIDLSGLSTPPHGVYAVTLKHAGKEYAGIANLGIAPTLRQYAAPLLEVHLFDFNGDLYGMNVEVVMHDFIRPEHRFQDVHELKNQIAKDVLRAKELLSNKPI